MQRKILSENHLNTNTLNKKIMAENENQEKQLYENVQYSLRAPRYSVKLFREIAEEFSSPGAAFERIVNEHADGIKPQVEANEKAVSGLQAANQKITELEALTEAKETRIHDLEVELESLKETNRTLAEQNGNLNDDLARMAAMPTTTERDEEGVIRVPVTPLDRACLQWMADRENRDRRRSDITPATFFMYAVREMLIKGNKFSIKCVPDSIVDKLKKELNHE